MSLFGAARAPGSLTLDQLIALNDEIAALARAGMPLERALMSVGDDLPGRLGKISQSLATDLANGMTLDQAVAAEGASFPPLYRAVVEAGIRSGRLASALEALAGFARSYAELRRVIALAMIYPLMVMAFAYALAMAFVFYLLPRLLDAFQTLGLPSNRMLDTVRAAGRTAIYWGPMPPLLLLSVMLMWRMTGRARSFASAGGMTRWFPWVRGMFANAQAANFADLLALLVGHSVPFADGLELAAGSSANLAMMSEAREIAARIRLGAPAAEAWPASGAFPPLLRWLIVSASREGALVESLRYAAESYRRRALLQAELLRAFLPTILLILIGAVATYLVAALFFIPFADMIGRLSAV